MCRLHDSLRREVLFVDGLDRALVFYGYEDDYSWKRVIDDSMRYDGPQDPGDTMDAAFAFMAAWLSGDCDTVWAMADVGYADGCPDPTGRGVSSGQSNGRGLIRIDASSINDATDVQTFDVQLQHEFGGPQNRGEWKVASVTPVG